MAGAFLLLLTCAATASAGGPRQAVAEQDAMGMGMPDTTTDPTATRTLSTSAADVPPPPPPPPDSDATPEDSGQEACTVTSLRVWAEAIGAELGAACTGVERVTPDTKCTLSKENELCDTATCAPGGNAWMEDFSVYGTGNVWPQCMPTATVFTMSYSWTTTAAASPSPLKADDFSTDELLNYLGNKVFAGSIAAITVKLVKVTSDAALTMELTSSAVAPVTLREFLDTRMKEFAADGESDLSKKYYGFLSSSAVVTDPAPTGLPTPAPLLEVTPSPDDGDEFPITLLIVAAGGTVLVLLVFTVFRCYRRNQVTLAQQREYEQERAAEMEKLKEELRPRPEPSGPGGVAGASGAKPRFPPVATVPSEMASPARPAKKVMEAVPEPRSTSGDPFADQGPNLDALSPYGCGIGRGKVVESDRV